MAAYGNACQTLPDWQAGVGRHRNACASTARIVQRTLSSWLFDFLNRACLGPDRDHLAKQRYH